MANLWKVGVVLLLVVTILPMLSVAWSDHSRSEYHVENESLVVDYDDSVPVETAAVNYSATVTITNDGTTLDAGDDYAWNASSGEVTFTNSSATSSGETVLIDYGYYERSDTTLLAGNVITPWGRVIALLLVFALIVGGYNFAVGGGGAGGL